MPHVTCPPYEGFFRNFMAACIFATLCLSAGDSVAMHLDRVIPEIPNNLYYARVDDVATDAAGNTYLLMSGQWIVKLDANNEYMRTYYPLENPEISPYMDTIRYIAVSSEEILYVSDGSFVYAFESDGTLKWSYLYVAIIDDFEATNNGAVIASHGQVFLPGLLNSYFIEDHNTICGVSVLADETLFLLKADVEKKDLYISQYDGNFNCESTVEFDLSALSERDRDLLTNGYSLSLEISEGGHIFAAYRYGYKIFNFLLNGSFVQEQAELAPGQSIFTMHGMAYNDNSDTLFVILSGDNSLKLFDDNLQYLGELSTRSENPGCFDQPRELAFTPEGELVVGNMQSWEAGLQRLQRFTAAGDYIEDVLIPSGGSQTYPIPTKFTYGQDGRQYVLFNTGNGPRSVKIFDANGSYQREITMYAFAPNGDQILATLDVIKVPPSGNIHLWAQWMYDELTIFSNDGELLHYYKIPEAEGVLDMDVDAGGSTYVLAKTAENTPEVRVLDATLDMVRSFPLDFPFYSLYSALAVSPDGSSIYVACSGSVYHFSPSGTLRETLKIWSPETPFEDFIDMEVAPDGQALYLSDYKQHSVIRVDILNGGALVPALNLLLSD